MYIFGDPWVEGVDKYFFVHDAKVDTKLDKYKTFS